MKPDIDRLVAEIAPDPGPGMTPGARELLDEIAAISAEAPESVVAPHIARHHRRSRGEGSFAGGIRRRRVIVPLAVGLAAAVILIAPPVTRLGTPAYALTDNVDGSITVKINEFRAPDRLERDLAKRGVRADVSYLEAGRKCAFGRFTSADPNYVEWDGRVEPDPRKREKYLREAMSWPSVKVAFSRPTAPNEFELAPRYIRPGQTLVLEVIENKAPASGPDRRRWPWQFSSYLAVSGGSVKPCTVVGDPNARPWNDANGRPVPTPPPGD
jgi:hypothetical protein